MVEGQEGVEWADWVALARACERLGFDALFRSDHYLSVGGRAERGSLDAWGTVSALAAITTKLRLGTLVSPATFRHPSVLAKAAVTAARPPRPPGALPPPGRPGGARRPGRPHRGGGGRAGRGAGLARGGARGLRFPFPADGRADGAARRAARGHHARVERRAPEL